MSRKLDTSENSILASEMIIHSVSFTFLTHRNVSKDAADFGYDDGCVDTL